MVRFVVILIEKFLISFLLSNLFRNFADKLLIYIIDCYGKD